MRKVMRYNGILCLLLYIDLFVAVTVEEGNLLVNAGFRYAQSDLMNWYF